MGCTLLLPYLKHSKSAGSDLADKPQKFLEIQKAQHHFTFLALLLFRALLEEAASAPPRALVALLLRHPSAQGASVQAKPWNEGLSHDPFGRSWEL